MARVKHAGIKAEGGQVSGVLGTVYDLLGRMAVGLHLLHQVEYLVKVGVARVELITDLLHQPLLLFIPRRMKKT